MDVTGVGRRPAQSQPAHLSAKSSVQRVPRGGVLKYAEHGTEVISRFGAKSLWQDRALPELEKGDARVVGLTDVELDARIHMFLRRKYARFSLAYDFIALSKRYKEQYMSRSRHTEQTRKQQMRTKPYIRKRLHAGTLRKLEFQD